MIVLSFNNKNIKNTAFLEDLDLGLGTHMAAPNCL